MHFPNPQAQWLKHISTIMWEASINRAQTPPSLPLHESKWAKSSIWNWETIKVSRNVTVKLYHQKSQRPFTAQQLKEGSTAGETSGLHLKVQPLLIVCHVNSQEWWNAKNLISPRLTVIEIILCTRSLFICTLQIRSLSNFWCSQIIQVIM